MKLNLNFTSCIALLFSALIISGCDTNTTTNSVEGPNPSLFKPTGTIVGTLIDATTNEPIVGAVIDVGAQKATTNANGVFILAGLAATTDTTGSSTVAGSYTGVIDFTAVTSPINMATTTSSKYPDQAVAGAFSVDYSSLEDSSLAGNGSADTVAANHDTPISGLVGSVNWTQGKLSTTISGEIRDSDSNALVTEAYTVQLFNGAVLLQELTTATGTESAFSFSGVQATTAHSITVFNSNNSMSGTRTFTSPADNQTSTLTVGGTAQPLLVTETDAADPYIYNIAINDGTTAFENGADIGAAAMATIAFTFSEAIKADGYTTSLTPTTGANNDLYDNVTVAVTAKAGNVAHSMAWDAAMTVLTVTVPTLAASSIYTVTIDGGNSLLDANDEPLDEANSTGHTGGTVVATFSTSNPVAVTAPTVSVLNSSALDEAPGAVVPVLDWTWGAGASSYNVYRTDTTAGSITSGMALMGNVGASSYTGVFASYVSGELPVTYTYSVKAVNADGTESDAGTATAADVNGPIGASTAGSCVGTNVTVTFTGGSEVLDEASAETAANYTMGGADAALTIDSIVATANTAVLTLSAVCTTGTVVVGVGVTDVAGNAHGATPAATAGVASGALAY